MLPSPASFSIYPSVVPADKQTQMTIAPNEMAYSFLDGAEFKVKVISVNGDENYYEPSAFSLYDVVAKDGCVTFLHAFESEGEHTVLLLMGDRVRATFSVYSLKEDLFALKPLRGDLHSHSCRSDGSRDPAAQFGHYREHGFDFTALTDHNRYYPGDEIDDAYKGVDTGITRVTGEEIHCPGSVLHIVHVGGRESIADRYINHREDYEREIEEYMKRVPSDIPEKYKSRYAKAMWVSESAHKVGGIAIFAHPYWKPIISRVYNVNDEFSTILLKSGLFDAYELIGGMLQTGNNRSVALWADLRQEGLKIPVVGSSDAHGLDKSTFDHCFTVCFAKANENDSIIEAVRSGNCVAVESTGDGYDKEYRCYGSLRLVSYAQFLLANYFPKRERLGEGLGVAMRSYYMGDADASLVNSHKKLLDLFYDRFFGMIPPPAQTESMKTFENKWREVQVTVGPKTRAGSVDAPPTPLI